MAAAKYDCETNLHSHRRASRALITRGRERENMRSPPPPPTVLTMRCEAQSLPPRTVRVRALISEKSSERRRPAHARKRLKFDGDREKIFRKLAAASIKFLFNKASQNFLHHEHFKRQQNARHSHSRAQRSFIRHFVTSGLMSAARSQTRATSVANFASSSPLVLAALWSDKATTPKSRSSLSVCSINASS